MLSKNNLWMFFLKNWCHLSNKDVQCQTLPTSFVQHISFICLIWVFFFKHQCHLSNILMSFCQHFLCVVAFVNIQCMTLDLHVLSQSFACLNCALIFHCNLLQNCCWWYSILIFNYVIKKKYEIDLTHFLLMCNGQNLWRCNPHNWICMCYQKTTFRYLNSAK